MGIRVHILPRYGGVISFLLYSQILSQLPIITFMSPCWSTCEKGFPRLGVFLWSLFYYLVCFLGENNSSRSSKYLNGASIPSDIQLPVLGKVSNLAYIPHQFRFQWLLKKRWNYFNFSHPHLFLSLLTYSDNHTTQREICHNP